MSLTTPSQIPQPNLNEETKQNGSAHSSGLFDPTQNQAIPTFQEWQKNIQTTQKDDQVKNSVKATVKPQKAPKPILTNSKSITSAEIHLRHSPKKIKSLAHAPLLSSPSKSPLTARGKPISHSQTADIKPPPVKQANSIPSNLHKFVPETMSQDEMIKMVKDNKKEIEAK